MHTIVRDWQEAPLNPTDMALCTFAEKLTLHPSTMAGADIEVLRSVGLDDRAIHDAVQIIGYFNYINRVADALGVEPETFINLWGR